MRTFALTTTLGAAAAFTPQQQPNPLAPRPPQAPQQQQAPGAMPAALTPQRRNPFKVVAGDLGHLATTVVKLGRRARHAQAELDDRRGEVAEVARYHFEGVPALRRQSCRHGTRGLWRLRRLRRLLGLQRIISLRRQGCGGAEGGRSDGKCAHLDLMYVLTAKNASEASN